MILRLPFAIKDLLPAPGSIRFTELEALTDMLITGYDGTVNTEVLAGRWTWQRQAVEQFMDRHRHFFTENIYEDEDTAPARRQRAQEVLDVFNQVFDCSWGLNEYRIRTINARIAEGKKMKPKVGITQFRAVFEHKKKEWTGTEQERHLTIETLCAAKHFLKYLEAARLDYIKHARAKKTETEGVKLSGTAFKTNG